jgi:hypothetical protein
MEGILVPISFFAMIAAIVIGPRYFRSIERQKLADTLRVAMEKGQPLPPEIVEAMSSNVRATGLPPSPQRDMRTGIIWLGIAAGFVALGAIAGFEEPDVTYWMLGLAAFPGFIGLAFVALGFIHRPKS